MRKILKNKLFEKGGILDVAPGNASTIFHYYDKESRSKSLIQSGITIIAAEEGSD
jgi:hypothetical protein